MLMEGLLPRMANPTNRCVSVWYIYAQRYRDHHDDEFIRRCERVRRQFILTSALWSGGGQPDCIDDLALSTSAIITIKAGSKLTRSFWCVRLQELQESQYSPPESSTAAGR